MVISMHDSVVSADQNTEWLAEKYRIHFIYFVVTSFHSEVYLFSFLFQPPQGLNFQDQGNCGRKLMFKPSIMKNRANSARNRGTKPKVGKR